MKIKEIVSFFESFAHPSLQEQYDNAGLITGDPERECKAVLCSLDTTEEVVEEAIDTGCDLIVSHHPIVFSGLKKINGKNYVERAIIRAIKNDIAIYAIHTNLDNVKGGVNGKIASLLGLKDISVLSPKPAMLKKLFVFVPLAHAEQVRQAIFKAGGGKIGNYSECSFNAEGTGTFTAGEGADPFVGKQGVRHEENELRIEVVIPSYLEESVTRAMREAHPYEEVAFDVIALSNAHNDIGSGMIGSLPQPMAETQLLAEIKQKFNLSSIRHTALLNKPVSRVALCGGAGSFLISKALAAKADVYITSDIKYHEFFDAEKRLLLCDIGHYESEQYTIDLLMEVLAEKFPTFAVRKTTVITNPVHYF